MFRRDPIADIQNCFKLVKSARQEKHVGIVREKVDLQTKRTVTAVVADVVIFIIKFISQETISNKLYVSMNSVGHCNHEVTVSVILVSDLVCLHFSLFHKKIEFIAET